MTEPTEAVPAPTTTELAEPLLKDINGNDGNLTAENSSVKHPGEPQEFPKRRLSLLNRNRSHKRRLSSFFTKEALKVAGGVVEEIRPENEGLTENEHPSENAESLPTTPLDQVANNKQLVATDVGNTKLARSRGSLYFTRKHFHSHKRRQAQERLELEALSVANEAAKAILQAPQASASITEDAE